MRLFFSLYANFKSSSRWRWIWKIKFCSIDKSWNNATSQMISQKSQPSWAWGLWNLLYKFSKNTLEIYDQSRTFKVTNINCTYYIFVSVLSAWKLQHSLCLYEKVMKQEITWNFNGYRKTIKMNFIRAFFTMWKFLFLAIVNIWYRDRKLKLSESSNEKFHFKFF